MNRKIIFFLSWKLLWNRRHNKKRMGMAPLAKLSLWLVIVCTFIPILILSITRGFQYFSLDKLSSFYGSFFVNLNAPISRPKLEDSAVSKAVQSYYQDFVFLKNRDKGAPSLMRAMSPKQIQTLFANKSLIFLQKTSVKKPSILLSESLAISLGLSVGSTVDTFMFLPHNLFPVRKGSFIVSSIISFRNATLDRLVSIISPDNLQSQFFINASQVNTFTSSSPSNLNRVLPTNPVMSLDEVPSVKQMQQQYLLLLMLALMSSCVCFFALFMNLKTNLKAHLYSLHILRVLGFPESQFIRAFFLQNILLVILGYVIGASLSLLIVPHIASIIQGFQDFLNSGIIFLRTHIQALHNLTLFEFLPTDVFYIQRIPVKMSLFDFLWLGIFLLGGIMFIQKQYSHIFKKRGGLEIMKQEQGV